MDDLEERLIQQLHQVLRPENFAETLAKHCFPDLVQPAVILELEKPGDYRNQVNSLARSCIRDTIGRRIKPESNGFVKFKLLFQEELDILATSQLIIDPAIFHDEVSFEQVLNQINRYFNVQNNHRLKGVPRLMRKVIEQNLDGKKHRSVGIVIKEKSFCMVLDENVVVETSSGNYNTRWPLVFARIAFEKNIGRIQLEVEIHDEAQAEDVLSSFINQIGLVGPDDQNWELARRHNGSIYSHNSVFYSRIVESVPFLISSYNLQPPRPTCLRRLQRIYFP